MNRAQRRKLLLTLPCYCLVLNNCNPAPAQIAPDGSLSTNVTTQNNRNFTINDGNRAGNNLFHSFREFSVPTGGEAFFNNAADIQNIFSRVTGGSISNIDGLIRANGRANLFLLNPSGIIFGPNARLNIGGSFMASTARSLIFSDGTQFSATNTQTPPLLTISVPVGLQYGSKAEPIRVQGSRQIENPQDGETKAFDNRFNTLEVNQGNTLTLVGGNVIIDGGILQAPGGRVEVGGLAGEGTIAIDENGSLSFPTGVQRSDVSIINKAGINVLAGGGGHIAINANNLEISDSLLTSGIATGLGTQGAKAGNIAIDAAGAITITFSRIENNINPESDEQRAAIGDGGDIIIQAGSSLTTDTASLSTGTFGQGNGGNLMIKANSVSLTNGTDADSITWGLGNAGNIEINAKENVVIVKSILESDIQDTLGKGNAGNILVQGNGLVSIFDSKLTSEVPANAAGKGGNIIIEADSISMIQNTPTGLATTTKGDGDAGNIILTAKDGIEITNSIISSDTFGAGNAGFVEINAGGAIALVGTDINTQVKSGSGKGGIIAINGGSVAITDASRIQTSTFDGQQDAGKIGIFARDTLKIVSSNITSNAEKAATGNAGNLSIASDGSISISGGTLIESSNFVGGDAGFIDLNAKDSISIVNSNIFSDTFSNSTQTRGGFAGIITIKAGNSFALSLQSEITAESFGDAQENKSGSGLGIISIDAGSVLLSNQANLSTSTYGTGDAGNIEINAQSVSLTDDSTIESSTFGVGEAGDITINAKDAVGIGNSTILSNAEDAATGDAGNIAIAARVVTLTDKATLGSSNFVGGNAGSVTVKAIDDISIINSSIFSDTVGQGTSSGGFAGGISITAGNLFAVNNGQITADSFGSKTENVGEAESGFGFISIEAKAISLSNQTNLSTGAFGAGAGGDITVRTQRLFITDKSRIAAETESAGNGGDIQLEARDLIVLRRNSNISTSAGKNGTNGDGGNITIKTPNLVALENSDIAADAFNGRGGRVSITAQGIFGAQAGTKDTPNSDITAISQVGGPELSGTVEINTPNVDPSSGLIELPQTVVDITGLIDRRCSPTAQQSSFVATGRGGLPPSPTEPLNDSAYLVDLVDINSARQESRRAGEQARRKESSQITEIVEAQGWIINDKGQVVLVANPPNVTPHRSGLIPIECHVR